MAISKKVREVFNKGKKVRGLDPNRYRKDDCGNIIYLYSHGKHSAMGWEKDHKIPKSHGGSNELSNLRPLKTSANRKRGNKKLKCAC